MTKPTYEELQAQVERLQNLILEVINTDADEFFMMGTDWGGAAIASLSETPADSLAALKAQWQAEACQYEDGMPAQQAFWEGFERGAVGRNNLNIRAHWREYVGFKKGANK